jgi:hypothetical protein
VSALDAEVLNSSAAFSIMKLALQRPGGDIQSATSPSALLVNLKGREVCLQTSNSGLGLTK